jgi:hypothetical protein
MGAMLGSFFSYHSASVLNNLISKVVLVPLIFFFCSSTYQHILYCLLFVLTEKNVIQKSFEFLDLLYPPMPSVAENRAI